jgi:hypothetical protein
LETKARGGDIKFWIGAFVMKVQKLVLKGESCWLTSSHLGQTAETALVIIIIIIKEEEKVQTSSKLV